MNKKVSPKLKRTADKDAMLTKIAKLQRQAASLIRRLEAIQAARKGEK